MADEKTEERHSFQIDLKGVLSILLQNNFISGHAFIQELIMNSIDAINSRLIQTESLTEVDASLNDAFIHIFLERRNRKLTVIDNGIGMDKTDLINYLGTIFKCGPRDKFDGLQEKFLGKNGVGFYSVFIVAKKVTVTTKKHDKVYQWIGTQKNFKISEVIMPGFTQGTVVELHMKNAAVSYLEKDFLTNYVLNYFKFIDFTINFTIVDSDDVDTLQMIPFLPLWKMPEVLSIQRYQKFYQQLTFDKNEFMSVHNFKIYPYDIILFVPKCPDDLKLKGIQLYSNQVLVKDKFQILPKCLNFFKGIISNNFMDVRIWNCSHFENRLRHLKIILIDRCLQIILTLAKSHISEAFYKTYENNIKNFALVSEVYKKQIPLELIDILKFNTSDDDLEKKTLVEFQRLNNSHNIFYLVGDSRKEIDESHYSEVFRFEEREIVVAYDSCDISLLDKISSYGKYKLVPLTMTGCSPPSSRREKAVYKKSVEDFKPLCQFMKCVLGDRIGKIIVSRRLITGPCCVTSQLSKDSAYSERQLRAHSILADFNGHFPVDWKTQKDFEINTFHPIIVYLSNFLKNGEEDDINDRNKNIIFLLVTAAELSAGYTITNTQDYVKKIYEELIIQNNEEVESMFDETELANLKIELSVPTFAYPVTEISFAVPEPKPGPSRLSQPWIEPTERKPKKGFNAEKMTSFINLFCDEEVSDKPIMSSKSTTLTREDFSENEALAINRAILLSRGSSISIELVENPTKKLDQILELPDEFLAFSQNKITPISSINSDEEFTVSDSSDENVALSSYLGKPIIKPFETHFQPGPSNVLKDRNIETVPFNKKVAKVMPVPVFRSPPPPLVTMSDITALEESEDAQLQKAIMMSLEHENMPRFDNQF